MMHFLVKNTTNTFTDFFNFTERERDGYMRGLSEGVERVEYTQPNTAHMGLETGANKLHNRYYSTLIRRLYAYDRIRIKGTAAFRK